MFRSLLLKSSTNSHLKSQILQIQTLPGISQDKFDNICEVFGKYGFKNDKIAILVEKNEVIFRKPLKTLAENIEFWRNFEFKEKQFQELIAEHPKLLDIKDRQHIAKKISHIKYYVKTSKNIWQLLFNSPEILSCKENEIENYFTYLEQHMRLSIPEIVKSQVFSKPLNELKCRHIFLERLGLFKPRSLKNDPNETTSNPRLYKIIDTSDQEFCKKVCGISLIEFETFAELISIEQENAIDLSEDDASDDD